MLCFIFAAIAQSVQRPIILLHGHGGVKIHANLSKAVSVCGTSRYIEVWPNIDEPGASFMARYPSCVAYLLESKYNATDSSVAPNTEVVYDIPEEGSLDDTPVFESLRPFLESKGYEYKKNLFGFPYNWIQYPTGTPALLGALRNFIESVHRNTGEKVIVLAHSMGSHVVRSLLTKTVDDAWVKEHIDGLIFNAPALYGCSGMFDYIISGKFSRLPINTVTSRVVRKMPSLHVMFDNRAVFPEKVVVANTTIFGGNVTDVLLVNVSDFLAKKGWFNAEALNIFRSIEATLDESPVKPPVRSLILYNSAIKTVASYSGDKLEEVYEGGDGTCQSGGADFICTNWNNAKCIDWNIDDANHTHSAMLAVEEAHKQILEFMNVEHDDGSIDVLMYVMIALVVVAVLLIAALVVVIIICKRRSG